MSSHADTIRDALPYAADDHHGRCALASGEPGRECDCYAKSSSAAHASLDALEADLALSRNLYDELSAQTEQLRRDDEALMRNVTRVEAENQRLRDALEAFHEIPKLRRGPEWALERGPLEAWMERSRAALGGTPSAAE